MNPLILRLQTIQVRLLLTIFSVVTALLISTAIDYGNALAAQAKSLTPEATAYQVASTRDENAQEQDGLPNKKLIEKSQQQLKSRADDVREKLNLEQPSYSTKKDFFETAQDKVKEAVAGTRQSSERATERITENR
jgi:uncharacterized membrane protein